LTEAGIKPAMIVGSSMGALVGAYYARWGDVKGLREFAEGSDLLSLIKLVDFNFISVSQGFIRGKRIEKLLGKLIGKAYFRNLKIPLVVTATDIYGGKKVVIQRGLVVKAVRASISIPAIFSPFYLKGRILIDGGIIEPLPILIAKELGGRFIIASNVLRAHTGPRAVKKKVSLQNVVFQHLPRIYRHKFFSAFEKQKEKPYPNIFQTIIQSFYAMEYELIRKESQEADIMIECGVDNFGSFEFHRAGEIITAGYTACQKALAGGYY